jgi:hypothetical protein
MTTPTAEAPTGAWSRFTAGWDRFWFRPADPTPLGVIRIVAGILVVYLHLAYTLDLQEFFGPHSWFGAREAEQYHHHLPCAPPATSWEDDNSIPNPNPSPFTVVVPEDLEAREAVVNFFRHLPDNLVERQRRLRYLDAQHLPNDAIESIRLLSFAKKMFDADEGPEARLQSLVDMPEDPAKRDRVVPPSVQRGAPERRAEMRDALRDLLALAASDPKRPLAVVDRGRDLVIDFLLNQTFLDRQRLLVYLEHLPTDRAERDDLLGYLQSWRLDKRLLVAEGQRTWSVWYHIQDPAVMAWVHGAIIVVMVLFTLGFCTRVTGALTWLAALSYINRSQAVLFGMDTMMNILLVYLVIGPSGAALSVDRLIARFRAARAAQREARRAGVAPSYALADPPRLVSANLAIRLIQIHFCFIYLASGLSKLKGPAWWEHSAPWYTVANPEFSPIDWPIYEQALRAMTYFRPIFNLNMSVMVAFTIAMEIGLPFLVWTYRLRPYVVLGAVLLHVGIAVFMGLTGFSLFMMTLLLAYFPASTFRDRLAAVPGSLPRLRLRGDSRLPAHARWLAVARAFDLCDQVEVHDQAAAGRAPTEATPLEVTTPDGVTHTGFGAFVAAARALRLLRPFAWLLAVPGVAALARSRFPDKAAVSAPRDKTGPTAPTAAS